MEQCSRLTGSNDESASADDILSEFATAGQEIIDPEPTPEEIEARKKAEEEAARKAEEEAAQNKAAWEAAEEQRKAADEQRKADERAREQREKDVLTAKKAELAAAGRLDLISKVKIDHDFNGSHAVVVSPDGSNDPDLKWTI